MSVTNLVASAARTTSAQSTAFNPVQTDAVNISVSVTAASGTTPTLDVTVEWSNDGAAWCVSDVADSFVQITAAKKTVKQFVTKAPYARLAWVVAGTTPSFTFSADMHAINTY